MNYKINSANNFTKGAIKNFKKIVIDAGEVSEKTFDGLIEKDPILLFYPDTINIDSVGALKIPYDIHKQKVFKDSSSDLNNTEYKYELGWVVSLKENKGIGKFISKVLSDYKPNIYATVRLDNEKMRHILIKTGFIQSGKPFNSERGDYQLVLYVKDKKNAL